MWGPPMCSVRQGRSQEELWSLYDLALQRVEWRWIDRGTVIEDMRGHQALGQPWKVEMGLWRARMNFWIWMKGRVSLVGKVVHHVIGPTAIHWLSISKLIRPVVQAYESMQRMCCRCMDLLAAPIGSGCIRDAKKRLHVRTMQRWTPPRYLYYPLFFTSLMGQCDTCDGTYRFGAYMWC